MQIRKKISSEKFNYILAEFLIFSAINVIKREILD